MCIAAVGMVAYRNWNNTTLHRNKIRKHDIIVVVGNDETMMR
jgi:hypothetical protein